MAETLSYAKTELTKALLSLLKKKKLHEITISELCNKAGLSRFPITAITIRWKRLLENIFPVSPMHF